MTRGSRHARIAARLSSVACLLRRHAEERVGRIRLVAVLGEPDRLRPEGAPDEDEELRERRHRDRRAVAAAAAGGRLGRRRRIRVVGVGVELRVGGGHAVDPGDGRHASQPAARRRHPAADARVRQHGVDRLVPGVEQMLDVDRRPRRPEPERLVRLVPDQPVAHPAVAPGGGARECAEVAGMRRRELRRPAAVRPGRCADQREHRRQTVAAKAAQNPVRTTPVVGGIAWRGRIRRPPLGDLVPAQREADERHTEPLERRQPLVERPRAVLQPRVVLDPVPHAARSLRGARGEARRDSHQRQHEEPQPTRARQVKRSSSNAGGSAGTGRAYASEPERSMRETNSRR